MPPIAYQIDARMKAHNFSIMELETQAGLKPHAVRNILTGKSKSPSAVKLQAIADVLGCTVKDLLSPPIVGTEESETTASSLEDQLQQPYIAGLPLMKDCITVIDSLLQKTSKSVTTGQFLTCVREVYLQSLSADSQKANRDFAEWFVGLL